MPTSNTVHGCDRYPELDALRGAAVLLMIAYHALFDASFFFASPLPGNLNSWTWLARVTATLFLLTIGIVSVISWQRTPQQRRWPKALRRAAIIFAGGMVVTLATWIAVPSAPVIFGILHLIGASALLQPLFQRLSVWNILVGIGAFCIPVAEGNWFTLPFGFPPAGFVSVDYYPLIPWFGIVLIGMGLGKMLYLPARSPSLQLFASIPYPTWLLWCGRNALLLYFLHQPVLLAVLYPLQFF